MRKLCEETLLTALAVVLAVLCVLVAYQVLARYLSFVPPMLWTEEVARGFLIWLVMLGAGYGFLKNEHFVMTAFVDALPPKTRRFIEAFVHVLVAVSGGLMVLSGVEFVERGWGRTSFASGLPAIWWYSAIIVGGAITALAGVASLLEQYFVNDQGVKSSAAERSVK